MKTEPGLTTAGLREGMRRVSLRMQLEAEQLNALDGKLGDGDLGVTMSRGFTHVMEAAPNFTDDLGQAFLSCAQAFTKESGSSFGTLFASALMSAAKKTRGRSCVPWSEMSSLLRGAFDAMVVRGKAGVGDKTVLDVLDAAARATEGMHDPKAILQAALRATEETMDRMRGQQARIGRARIFGERSIGLDDPGMAAFLVMLRGLRDAEPEQRFSAASRNDGAV